MVKLFSALGQAIDAEKRIMGGERYLKLDCVAADPAFQGRGFGSILVAPELQYADDNNLPCYLVQEMLASCSANLTRKAQIPKILLSINVLDLLK